MKKLILPFVLVTISCCSYSNSGAQLLKRIKNEVRNRVENRAVNGSGNAADAVMDEAGKAVSDAVNGKDEGDNAGTGNSGEVPSGTTAAVSKPVAADYKNYDFVAGDKIIFAPDLSREPDAELPARFSIIKGSAEIQSYEGEKILHLDNGSEATLSPVMSSDTYLPEQFTLEFDMMYENTASYFQYVNSFYINFCEKGSDNNRSPLYHFYISNPSQCAFGVPRSGNQHFPDALGKSMAANGVWHHIALYVHKNIGKAYIDQYRVAVSNLVPEGASHLYIVGDVHYGVKIRNFRLAAGGDDKYNKIVTDGKFITHGIQFDVNKSTIKPESAGTINEVAKLMKDHADLRFEIDGHTDSDGNADANMKLSLDRANAVKARLVSLGIEESRLTTRGFGATKPIDKNESAEGKANNRRVEFVKM